MRFPVPLDATPIDAGGLPSVLAGPILRRLTRTDVAVWLAASRPDAVTLRVNPAGQAAPATTGTATPTRVGSHVWLVTVRASAPGGQFAAGSLYEYRLTSNGWPTEPNWAELAIDTALPSFPGLPATVQDLVVMHTSCRKAHGGGLDALALTADLIHERVIAGVPNARPNLHLMSGDQLYADEVAAPLVPRIGRIAADLIGIDETSVFGALPRIGGRQGPSDSFGFTSLDSANHIWTFGEYLASYLLYWSDVLWPTTIPRWADVDPANDLDPASDLGEDRWNQDAGRLERFRAGLPRARKVLASVPSLMTFDDHDVTDDWNLDHPWARNVYAGERGGRVVLNGLLTYALCQHWGNVPERFASGTLEAQLLGAATFTGSSPDTPTTRALLGAPGAAPADPPSALRDLSTPGSLRYDLHLGPAEGYPVRVIVLDERTAREFVRVDEPAARISLSALALQLPPPTDAAPLTILVTPSPAFGSHLVEDLIQPAASLFPGGAEFADYDSWSGVTANHQELIARLAAYQPVVVLSGDVHYGFTGSVTLAVGGITSRFAQLTGSSVRNPETKHIVLQVVGDFATKVGVERARTYVGFDALTTQQRTQLASPPPAGSTLPYDDLADVALGRVFRAGQETPTVLSEEIVAAYGFGTGDWRYDVVPVDDQTLPQAGPLLDAMNGAPGPWPGWDPDRSYTMLGALRASDLHRLGRVWTGLPNVAIITFDAGTPPVVHHDLVGPVGEDLTADVRHHTTTRVSLG